MNLLRLVRPSAAVLGGIVFLVAGAQGPGILNRSFKAAQTLSYSAVRVTMIKGKPVTERIFASHGMHRIERNNVIIIENGRERLMFDRKANTLKRTANRPMGDKVRKGGKLGGPNASRPRPGPMPTPQLSDGGIVAGRATQLVTFPSGAAGQPEGRYWLDSQTSLILKASIPEFGKRPAVDYEFTQISYGNQPTTLFTEEFPGATIVDPRTDLVKVSKELSVPAFTISDGGNFQLVRVEKRTIGDRKVLHQAFRSENKMVSLFVTTGSVSQESLAKLFHNGSVLSWESAGYTLILLGNVSNQELQEFKGRVRA